MRAFVSGASGWVRRGEVGIAIHSRLGAEDHLQAQARWAEKLPPPLLVVRGSRMRDVPLTKQHPCLAGPPIEIGPAEEDQNIAPEGTPPIVVESGTEPVFSTEGAPASERRERSLRELFWGED